VDLHVMLLPPYLLQWFQQRTKNRTVGPLSKAAPSMPASSRNVAGSVTCEDVASLQVASLDRVYLHMTGPQVTL
jgi:hypothetical protein